jgi:hypothetical protein
MNVGNTTIWQVAAGDTNRIYADLCHDWDVIMTGRQQAQLDMC